jgi:hypothetical protein
MDIANNVSNLALVTNLNDVEVTKSYDEKGDYVTEYETRPNVCNVQRFKVQVIKGAPIHTKLKKIKLPSGRRL